VEQGKSEEWDFRRFATRKRCKIQKEERGGGEGKQTETDKPLDFENCPLDHVVINLFNPSKRKTCKVSALICQSGTI